MDISHFSNTQKQFYLLYCDSIHSHPKFALVDDYNIVLSHNLNNLLLTELYGIDKIITLDYLNCTILIELFKYRRDHANAIRIVNTRFINPGIIQSPHIRVTRYSSLNH